MSAYPGGSNVFVAGFSKNAETTQLFATDFSRNPDSFRLNDYVQIVPVKLDKGFYAEMGVEEGGRITNDDMPETVWADGDDAPEGRGNTESFEFKAYQTLRRLYNFRVGGKAVDQAPWDILAQNGRRKAQLAMTMRTVQAVTVATTAANYSASHTADVTAIPGVSDTWDTSTTADMFIKRSLLHGWDTIRKSTLGGVRLNELRLVLSPTCAKEIAMTQEVIDLIKQSPTAVDYLKKGLGNAAYGLPEVLYGIPVVIEDAVKVTSAKGASTVTADVMPDAKPFLCARPGGLVAPDYSQDQPNFSTLAMFMYEDMTVEEKYDVDNRIHRGRVVDDFVVKLMAPISGFLFTNAIA